MSRSNHSWRRSFKRYVLFQLPGYAALILLLLVLENWVDLPAWAIWVFIAAWIAKDILFFPFVWRSYRPPSAEDDRLLGESGICRERLSPSGYVFVGGELWKAELQGGSGVRPVEEGEPVVVVGRHGLRLIVVPKEEDNAQEEIHE